MKEEYFIGIDIGTSGSKGVLVDSDLNVIKSAYVEHEVHVPKPGWVEHDAEKIWWSDFKHLSGELLAESNIDVNDISGVGVSALHAAMVPLDGQGTPLRRAILYGNDTRTTEEIEILNEQIGEERIHDVCGNPLTFQSVGPKILWYKRNESTLFEQTEQILDATGYVVYKLTGNYTIDNAVASFFHPLYNLSELQWEDEMFGEVGIPRDLLPEPQWSTEIAGTVTKSASEETGLVKGTPVIVGTGDAMASSVSVGALDHGEAIFMYGTTGVIYTTLEEERSTESLWAFPHCLEGKYMMAGGMATSGALVRWFKNEFGKEMARRAANGDRDVYALLDEQAEQIDPGSDGLVLLPYFSGERTPICDDSARGTLLGLTLSHTNAHVYRAILEGVGYGFRHHLDAMNEANVSIKRVLAIGGGAQSPLWRQIVSDVTGATQENVTVPEGAPLGGAFLAGRGVGVFDNTDPLEETITVREKTVPNQEAKAVYDDYYSVYRDLYPKLKDSMHELTELADSSQNRNEKTI